jgi:hypothetical protein
MLNASEGVWRMKPLFTLGKQIECPLTQFVEEGSNQLPIAGASIYFSVGDKIFVSESEGSELEFLGNATAVETNLLTTAHPLSSDKNAGALVWKPSAQFEFEIGRSSPFLRSFDTGIEIQKTVGGQVYSTRVREPGWTETLTFSKLSRSNFLAFQEFLQNSLYDGLEEFTYVDEAGEISIVRLLTTQIQQHENHPKLVTLKLELYYVQPGQYT